MSAIAAACVGSVVCGCGCGGGGSGTSDAVTTPTEAAPADGSYAGTYKCTSSDQSLDLTFVVPTATGALSSCRGTGADNAVTIICTGSIANDGTLEMTGQDTHNNSLTFTGKATATLAEGTFTVAPAGVEGSFHCTH